MASALRARAEVEADTQLLADVAFVRTVAHNLSVDTSELGEEAGEARKVTRK
jgi:hypothetical protein